MRKLVSTVWRAGKLVTPPARGFSRRFSPSALINALQKCHLVNCVYLQPTTNIGSSRYLCPSSTAWYPSMALFCRARELFTFRFEATSINNTRHQRRPRDKHAELTIHIRTMQ